MMRLQQQGSTALLLVNTLLLVLLCWRSAWDAVAQSLSHLPRQHAAQLNSVEERIDASRKLSFAAESLARLVDRQDRLAQRQLEVQQKEKELVQNHDSCMQLASQLVQQHARDAQQNPHQGVSTTGFASRPASATLPAPSPSDWLATAMQPERLKEIWRMPAQRPGTRAATVEVQNETWSYFDQRQLSRGTVSVGDPLPLQCLASKLLERKSVKLSVVGGSVSFGTTFTTSRSRALFHWKVYQWINATFPAAQHEHYCGAVPASGPSYMEHCLHWHLADHSDLVLLEYAVNFEENGDDAAAFERMLRKLLQMPRRPAVVIVNTMELMVPSSRSLHFSGPKEYMDGYSAGEPSAEDMQFGYAAKAEDAINALGLYYGVPTVSLRNALFLHLRARDPAFPLKQVFHDRHHPGAWGHSLLAQLVIARIGEAARAMLEHGASSARACDTLAAEAAAATTKAASTAPSVLGPPLLSPTPEAPVGMCIKGEAIMEHVLSAKGFRFKVEGTDAKMKPGLIGETPGDEVRLCLDVSRLAPGSGFVAILGHLISYEHMGIAQVQCLGECECATQQVDAHVPGGKFSVFKAKTLAMKRREKPPATQITTRPNCGCVLQLNILNQTGSGEHKFKVLTLMTAAQEGSLRYGHQTGFNVRPMSARIS